MIQYSNGAVILHVFVYVYVGACARVLFLYYICTGTCMCKLFFFHLDLFDSVF